MQQSKMLLTIDERRGSKLDKTVFSITICRQSGDKWQSKTLSQRFFLSTFDYSINVFDCHLSGVITYSQSKENP